MDRENEIYKELDRKKRRERKRAIKSHTHNEGGREGGSEARKYLERRRIICAVVETISPGCSPTAQQAAFPLCLRNCCFCDEAMWIYKLLFGLFVISCSGKFGENHFHLLGLLSNVCQWSGAGAERFGLRSVQHFNNITFLLYNIQLYTVHYTE